MMDAPRRSLLLVVVLLASCATIPPSVNAPTPQIVPIPVVPMPVHREPKVALVLGGGAARGFAHVGVIKVLEAQDRHSGW